MGSGSGGSPRRSARVCGSAEMRASGVGVGAWRVRWRRARAGHRRRVHGLRGHRLDRHYRPSQTIGLGIVVPGCEEAPELGNGQGRSGLHVVAVLALQPVERSDDPHRRHVELRGGGRIGGGREPGQDPAVTAVRDGECDRQPGQPHPSHGRPKGRPKGPARDQAVPIVHEVPQACRPAGRVHARRLGQRVPVVLPHPFEVRSL